MEVRITRIHRPVQDFGSASFEIVHAEVSRKKDCKFFRHPRNRSQFVMNVVDGLAVFRPLEKKASLNFRRQERLTFWIIWCEVALDDHQHETDTPTCKIPSTT